MTAVDCSLKAPNITAKPRSVSVNGVEIPREDIARETQNHAASTPIAAWKMAARALAIRELLHQKAKSLGLQAEPVVDDEGRHETPDEAAMRALLDVEVKVPSADDATCQRYYEQNRAKFRSAPLYGVRHILVPAAPGDVSARATALEQAKILHERLTENPDRFESIAASHSACPSAKTGGNLGQIGPGQTVPEFEKALFQMDGTGLVPKPIETRYGFHIIFVDHAIEGRDLPFAMVKDAIAAYLDDSVQRRALQQYVTILASEATIVGIDIPSA